MSGLNLEVGDDRSQHVLRKHECSCCTSCTVQKFSFQHPSTPNQHFKCCFWRVKLKDPCSKFEVVPTHATCLQVNAQPQETPFIQINWPGTQQTTEEMEEATHFSHLTFALQRWVAWSDDNAFECQFSWHVIRCYAYFISLHQSPF